MLPSLKPNVVAWLRARAAEPSTRAGINGLIVIVVMVGGYLGVDLDRAIGQSREIIELVGTALLVAGVGVNVRSIVTPDKP